MASKVGSVDRYCYILEQPVKILETVLSYCTFDEIARYRLVCKAFDEACQSLLNRGFIAVDRYHAKCLKKVKSQLPRRESERRNHPLARHCDILMAIETRLSLLGMTYMKYVESNQCCFIPGKVIDEIYRVLRYVENTESPCRSHEILQELRDISSMATEHFDEKIIPTLRNRMATGPPALSPHGFFTLPSPTTFTFNTSRSTPWSSSIRQDLSRFQQLRQVNLAVKQDVTKCLNELATLKKKFVEQEKEKQQLDKRLEEQNRLIADQASRMNELNRKQLEYEQKFDDLLTEFNRSKETPTHAASKSVFENMVDLGSTMTLSTTMFENKMDVKLSVQPPSKSRLPFIPNSLDMASTSSAIVTPTFGSDRESTVKPYRLRGKPKSTTQAWNDYELTSERRNRRGQKRSSFPPSEKNGALNIDAKSPPSSAEKVTEVQEESSATPKTRKRFCRKTTTDKTAKISKHLL